jgi:ligand-binding sensor domain-containing protein
MLNKIQNGEMKTEKLKTITIKLAFIFGALLFCSSWNSPENTVANKAIQHNEKWLAGDTVSLIEGEIRDIFQDSKNNLWFASNGNGVYKYDGNTILNYTEKHGLPSNCVWLLKEGKDGNIWFKTNIRPQDRIAISCFNGYEFKTIAPDTNTMIYDFKNGDLLFDYLFDGKSLSKIHLPHTSPLKNDLNIRHHYDIYSTCIDKNGSVWFGTATAGICKYDGKNYSWFDNLELGSAIRDIFEDKNGTIWAGNNGDGLFRYDGKNFINFSREKNLHNPDFEKYPIGKPGLMSRVWKITEDNENKLWVATIDNGVWMYNGNTMTNYTTNEGLPLNAIWTLYKDRNGKLWFGTDGDGVYTFNGKTFNKFH